MSRFGKLQSKIEAEGNSKAASGAIAVSIGRKKYGNAKFAAMAKKKAMKGKK